MIVATYAISGTLSGIAGVIIAARNVNVKFDYGSSYLLIAILIAVMAGVKPEGGYGRVICVVLSAIALQLMSSLLNFGGLSNFVRDFAVADEGYLREGPVAAARFEIIGDDGDPEIAELRALRQRAVNDVISTLLGELGIGG
ncbi:ABC-type branched-subunit amino acid transport system permease subunit [Rhizobium sp. BK176]|nr:ABC-type branched-subunit amino acid transport system permease subunit [Rhizobium sp. BK181]MCS4096262.1 ABC-type branched-subunit amino acid transport system permease subunit [Rhizobium sp. BK176]